MSTSTFRFRCGCCGEIHEGLPTFSFAFPIQYMDVREAEREKRVFLNSELCVIDDRQFFARGLFEIPVHGSETPFAWAVWVRLTEKSFFRFQSLLDLAERSGERPFTGTLASPPRPYPDSTDLRVSMHPRDEFLRPTVVVIPPSTHPLAIEQRDGITAERLADIYEQMIHGGRKAPGS